MIYSSAFYKINIPLLPVYISASTMDIKKDVKTRILTDIDFPPPYSSTTGSQTLDVHYRHWGSHVVVTDSAGQELFVSQARSCTSTRLEILNRNKQLIGTSKCNDFTSKITIQMDTGAGLDRAFEIHNSRSVLGGSPKYKSPAFDGNEMVWKNKAMSSKIIYDLIGSDGVALAKFQSDPRSEIGKLQIGEITGEERIDEVVVTLLTLLHRKMRCIQAGLIAAIS